VNAAPIVSTYTNKQSENTDLIQALDELERDVCIAELHARTLEVALVSDGRVLA